MCQICLEFRPFDPECPYDAPAPVTGFDPDADPGYGETWAEWFEAPAGPHSLTDRGFMTPNSTFDGAIGHLGDSDWIRINLEKGQSYTIQLYSYSIETFLALADNNGNVLTSATYETVVTDVFTYAVCTLEVTASRNGPYFIISEEYGHDAIGAYTIGVIETEGASGPPETWDLDDVAHQLTDTGWDFFGGDRRSWNEDVITYNMQALNADMRPLIRHAFDAWEKVTGLTFKKVTSNNAMMTFDDEQSGAFASSTTSNGRIKSVDINFAKDWPTSGYTFDSYLFQTMLHEIGHGIGLAHAGNYNAGSGPPPSFPDDVLYANDSWNTTVMSYIDQGVNTEDDADYALVMTPMIADIIAVQELYGVPVKAYHGNTKYGLNSNTGDYMDDVFDMLTKGQSNSKLIGGDAPMTFTLWDTGGVDTINFKTDKERQRVDLREEALSDIYGVKGAMVIGRDTVIENYIAGKSHDVVIGNNAKNTLQGGAGNDTLKGLGARDKLKGGGGHDKLEGGNGSDFLFGQGGNDKLTGGAARDYFVFQKKGGKDVIRDFQDDLDVLRLDDRLWSGDLNANQVVKKFGSHVGQDVLLDFGNNQSIRIEDMRMGQIKDDIDII